MQEQKLHYWKNKKTFKRSDEADNRHFSPMGLVRMRAAISAISIVDGRLVL